MWYRVCGSTCGVAVVGIMLLLGCGGTARSGEGSGGSTSTDTGGLAKCESDADCAGVPGAPSCQAGSCRAPELAHAGAPSQAGTGMLAGAGGSVPSGGRTGTGGMTMNNGGTSAGTSGGGSGGGGAGGVPGLGGMVGDGGETGGAGVLPPLRLDDACGTLLSGNVCLHEGKQSDDGTPFTKSVTATLGGPAGMMYQLKIHVRGVVEPTHVIGGTPGIPPQFVIGGERYPAGSSEPRNQYWSITTSAPNAIYFLNIFSEPLSHVVRVIDYEEIIPIAAGATVTLQVDDGNAHSISNTLDNPPLSIAGIPGSVMSGQFVQIDPVM